MKKTLFIFSILTILFASCESDAAKEEAAFLAVGTNANMNYEVNENSFGWTPKNGDDKYGYNQSNQLQQKQKPQIERKLIKNGKVTFETEDLKATRSRISQLVKKHQAYFARESENESGNRMNVHLTIRVVAKHFDSLLGDISKGVEKFEYKQVKIQDVTEEFLDIQTRLKNKKELEQRYLQILKKAKNVKEILEVEKEIGKLREDIESAEGRLKYLQDQVSISTLEVSFYKEIYHETGFGKKLKDSFKDGFSGLKSLFLFLISVWPFLIIGMILWFLFKRRFKRKKSN